jgi:hypothetical protein
MNREVVSHAGVFPMSKAGDVKIEVPSAGRWFSGKYKIVTAAAVRQDRKRVRDALERKEYKLRPARP